MDKYQETKETWNKIAKIYQDKFMDLDLYNETYDFFCRNINADKAKILEVGCGPGNICKYLLSKHPEFEILGIDNSTNMVELAKANNPNASFIELDARRIHELKKNFDGIICGFVIPYLSSKDFEKFVHDCFNLLNENGLFYLSFVEGNPENSEYKIGSDGSRVYFYYYNLDQLICQLRFCKFEILATYKIPYFPGSNTNQVHTILTAMKTSAGM